MRINKVPKDKEIDRFWSRVQSGDCVNHIINGRHWGWVTVDNG